ncbi:MAG: hypothetical protein ACRD03_01815 [Acidimicrobiales bacterium]
MTRGCKLCGQPAGGRDVVAEPHLGWIDDRGRFVESWSHRDCVAKRAAGQLPATVNRG